MSTETTISDLLYNGTVIVFDITGNGPSSRYQEELRRAPESVAELRDAFVAKRRKLAGELQTLLESTTKMRKSRKKDRAVSECQHLQWRVQGYHNAALDAQKHFDAAAAYKAENPEDYRRYEFYLDTVLREEVTA